MRDAAAPARSRTNANPAGSEAIGQTAGSQQFPTHDTPASHLRNALAILELLDLGREATVYRAMLDVRGRIVQALQLLERADAAILPEPRRVAREMIQAIGRPSAAELQSALELELRAMDLTNRELRDLRLAADGPDELQDEDRRNDATGAR